MLFARRVLDTALGANWVLVFQQAEGAFGEDLLREVFGDFGGTRLSLRSPLRAPFDFANLIWPTCARLIWPTFAH